MSEQAINQAAEESLDIMDGSLSAFTSIMDTLATEAPDETTGQAGEEVPAAPANEGQPAPAPQGDGPEVADGNAPAGGDVSEPDPVQAAGTATPVAPATAGGSGSGQVDFYAIQSKFGEMSSAIETNTVKGYQQEAFAEAQKEFATYIDLIRQHPRMLVGKSVPALNHDGEEILRDSADAKEWQEATRQLLSEEIRDRAATKMEGVRGELNTLYESVQLFQNNADLVPGTKQFDKELADQVMAVAAPYALRHKGKLQGFQIPLQPLVDQARAQLATKRATAAATSAAPAAPAPQQAPAPVEAPQAGISSSAGQSAEVDDFSALFGTLGLPNLRL